MDQSFISKLFIKIGLAILLIALVDLGYLNYWVLTQGQKVKDSGSQIADRTITESSPKPTASAQPSALPAASAAPTAAPTAVPTTIVKEQTIVEKQTVVQTAQKQIIIPIGSGSTQSNTYTDLAAGQVAVDPTQYSAIESVKFEATIWVEGGNGRAYAQLKNVTDNNPLIESTISSTKGSGDYQISGNVPIPSNAKTYGIVAKTDLINFPAHVDSARMRITLK